MRAYRSLVKFVLRPVGILTLALTAALPTLAQTSPPVIVSTVGYTQWHAADHTHVSRIQHHRRFGPGGFCLY